MTQPDTSKSTKQEQKKEATKIDIEKNDRFVKKIFALFGGEQRQLEGTPEQYVRHVRRRQNP